MHITDLFIFSLQAFKFKPILCFETNVKVNNVTSSNNSKQISGIIHYPHFRVCDQSSAYVWDNHIYDLNT